MNPAIARAQMKLPRFGKFRRGLFQTLEVAAALALFACGTVRADTAFAAGKAAYDAGKFAEAEAQYRKVLADGKFAPELFFNLGNSEFKQGEVGSAVLNYRRAWMLAPRDPDIRANLRFALERGNAAGPELALPARALTKANEAEWSVVAMVAYWLAAALLLAFVLGLRTKMLLRGAAGLALLGAVALAGLLQWRTLRSSPELVVQDKTQALFGPIADATRKFELPEGSIVREISREGDWVNVSSGGESGWVPARLCERVYPWK